MQTNKLFEEGGILQEGGTVDPVSGNDVPAGSLQEEVRDDLDVKLSEGEFVFPADVVRYIGLEKLMQIRDAAKKGLARMAEIGQMGNAQEVENPDQLHGGGEEEYSEDFESEIDDIISEVDAEAIGAKPKQMAVGGAVTGPNPLLSSKGIPTTSISNPALDVRVFQNQQGSKMFITFVNGKPLSQVPSGYTQVGTGQDFGQPIPTPAPTPAPTGTTVSTASVAPVSSPAPTAAPTAAPASGGGNAVMESGGGGPGSEGGNTSGTGSNGIGQNSVSSTAVSIAGIVGAVVGIPGSMAVVNNAPTIANAMTAAVAANNQSVAAANLGLTPAEAATPVGQAAVASEVDALSSGLTGNTPSANAAAAAAAAAAADAAAAAGLGPAAIGAAAQAAADAAAQGASPAAAAAAGASAASAAAAAAVADAIAVAEAEAAANDAANDAATAAAIGSIGTATDDGSAIGSIGAEGHGNPDLAKGGLVKRKNKQPTTTKKGLAARK